MNNELPLYKDLTINKLASVFNNTSASYKYYWFISILDLIVKEQKQKISLWEIVIGMIAEAWYPIHYFRLSFGKSDSLYNQIIELQEELNIPIDEKKKEIKRQILNNIDTPKVKSLLRVFTLNVPYRFLSPWIKYTNNSNVISQSQSFTNNCIYAIKDDFIIINTNWEQYLNDNYLILRDFTLWNLTIFIQKRNPNTPNIASKLIKPIARGNLNTQRKFWDIVITELGSFECIYTGKPLNTGQYDIEHFIPWSFVSHDQIWNLIPADGSVNSSKSNKLPSLDKFLDPFSRIQHEAIKIMYSRNKKNKLLEDYLVLGSGIKYIAKEPFHLFKERYINIITPLLQIARNSGFENWEY